MASWWQKTVATAADVSGLFGGTLQILTHRSLPPKAGTFHITALHAPVEIITDHYGVAHIYAQNEDDLFFGQGYIHAQERLWQLEINRRLGAGRLSEIVGPVALETDRFLRRLGMHRAAKSEIGRLSEESHKILGAYTSGINTYIEQHRKQLPVEFTILRFEPEPFRKEDVLQWGKVQGWSLSGNWETELIRARLVNKLGAARASELEPGYDSNHPLIVPPGVSYQGINLGLVEQYQQLSTITGLSTMGGSNNWTIGGALTESGLPLLCNDPHLQQMVPSIWFECHLVAGDLNVTGASFPGAPGVIIGHNQRIAWGVTNAVSDVQDLYIEKFHPEHPEQYEFKGQWETATIVREEIQVKGQAIPAIEEVRVTRHGPIITHMPPLSLNQSNGNPVTQEPQEPAKLPLALHWTGLEQEQLIDSIRLLNKASNWEEFKTALHFWDVPPQNFVYADVDGNIGYIMAGAIPIRAQGQALLPVPGWTGEFEWTGLIPFDKLPQTYNPEQQYIATANNRVIDDSYPHYITHEWSNGYRAQRISDLITSGKKLTRADMAAIQNDQYSIPARDFVAHLLTCEASTPLKRAAQEIMQAWDYVLSIDSIAASIYTIFASKLERIVLDAVIGDDEQLLASYLGKGITTVNALNDYTSRFKPLLLRLLKEQDASWFANSAVPNGPNSWKAALNSAFDATIDELSDRLGNNILQWKYGAIHKLSYSHPLGSVKALQASFNRGPFPIGGNSDTVNVALSAPGNLSTVIAVASYRQIIDLHDLDASQSIHSPGQSGQPGSAHYDDLIPLWRTGHYHPMHFTRGAVEQAAEGKITLTPQNLPARK
ncbi:peptidase S45 [Ktedonobacteria bacterium brp13]|nr:peptidase S45 [Ktedonobacteria bacterium brp13]